MTIINYDKWLKDVEKSIERTVKIGSNIISKTADEFRRRVIKRTPVGDPTLWQSNWVPPGYKPGKLKASWKKLTKKHNGRVSEILVYNTQIYAARVEMGWSTQAPAGMMRVTIKEIPGIMRQITSKLRNG